MRAWVKSLRQATLEHCRAWPDRRENVRSRIERSFHPDLDADPDSDSDLDLDSDSDLGLDLDLDSDSDSDLTG